MTLNGVRSPDAIIGARLDGFRVLRESARGATGRIYLALDEGSGEVVVLKVPVRAGVQEYGVLRREAAMLTRLGRRAHANVVRVLASGIDEHGTPWYAMEHVAGRSLEALNYAVWLPGAGRARGGDTIAVTARTGHANAPEAENTPTRDPDELALPFEIDPARRDPARAGAGHLDELLTVALQLAEALAFVHSEGIVHGDVSPRNVLVPRSRGAVLCDFGTAFVSERKTDFRDVTQEANEWLGTPGYIAPERLKGEPTDGRADLYAFGCILFELVTGRRPFLSENPRALSDQHRALQPLAPSRLVAGVPAELERLILELLAKHPAERTPHADAVVDALAALCGKRTSAPRSALQLYRPRLTGRSAELARLNGWITSMLAGQGGVGYVLGESGIGKTRLLNELGRIASGFGVEVFVGQATRGDSLAGSGAQTATKPLQVFQSLLERVGDLCASEAGARDEELRLHWAHLAPYRTSFQRPAKSEPPGNTERGVRQVVQALRGAISILVARRPLLLVLDDLQWADELTQAFLLSREAASLNTTRALIVGAMRVEQAPAALTHAVPSLAPDRVLRLGGLDVA